MTEDQARRFVYNFWRQVAEQIGTAEDRNGHGVCGAVALVCDNEMIGIPYKQRIERTLWEHAFPVFGNMLAYSPWAWSRDRAGDAARIRFCAVMAGPRPKGEPALRRLP